MSLSNVVLPAVQPLTARFEDKQVLNAKFTLYKFELSQPHRFTFLAGQYVSIQVDDAGNRRSYSICSKPSIDHGFELLVDTTPQGLGVQYLESLKFGDTITALGPMGQFILANPLEPELYFIASGSGIAPFYGMITQLLQDEQETRPMYLYWGLRHAEDLCWQDEFQLLSQAFSNFRFEPTLSQAPDGWPLSRGRVTDVFFAHDCSPSAGYYLCGNGQMIQDMQKLLTEEKHVPSERIHFEKFY